MFDKIKNILKKINCTNKFKNNIKSINFLVFILFIMILINFIMSIFLFKKSEYSINEIQAKIETDRKRFEGKTNAMYSQLQRLRIMAQMNYYNPPDSE